MHSTTRLHSAVTGTDLRATALRETALRIDCSARLQLFFADGRSDGAQQRHIGGSTRRAWRPGACRDSGRPCGDGRRLAQEARHDAGGGEGRGQPRRRDRQAPEDHRPLTLLRRLGQTQSPGAGTRPSANDDRIAARRRRCPLEPSNCSGTSSPWAMACCVESAMASARWRRYSARRWRISVGSAPPRA